MLALLAPCSMSDVSTRIVALSADVSIRPLSSACALLWKSTWPFVGSSSLPVCCQLWHTEAREDAAHVKKFQHSSLKKESAGQSNTSSYGPPGEEEGVSVGAALVVNVCTGRTFW